MIALTVSGPARCARWCRMVYSRTTSWVDVWFLTRVEAGLRGGMRYGLLHPATTVVWFYLLGVSTGSNRLHHVRVLQIPLPASERLATFAIVARLHSMAAWICDHDEPARSIEGRCSTGRKLGWRDFREGCRSLLEPRTIAVGVDGREDRDHFSARCWTVSDVP